MSYEPDMPAPSSSVARDKVSLPGIFLLIVGILNILFALYNTFSGAMAMMQPQQAAAQMKEGMSAEDRKKLEELGWSPEKLMQKMGVGFVVVSVIGLLAGAITTFAGIKMRALQSRGLVILGSVLAMLPCVSPCCLAGLPIGIWALVALSNPDVKAAFRS